MKIPMDSLSDLRVVPVDIDTTEPVTSDLYTPESGKRWVCFASALENTETGAVSVYTWRSGSTDISGAQELAVFGPSNVQSRIFDQNGGEPAMVGRIKDETLTLYKTGTGAIAGWVLVASIS